MCNAICSGCGCKCGHEKVEHMYKNRLGDFAIGVCTASDCDCGYFILKEEEEWTG